KRTGIFPIFSQIKLITNTMKKVTNIDTIGDGVADGIYYSIAMHTPLMSRFFCGSVYCMIALPLLHLKRQLLVWHVAFPLSWAFWTPFPTFSSLPLIRHRVCNCRSLT